MGNNYIYNVKTLVNNDQGANKSYVDQHVAKSGDTMTGVLHMNGKKVTNLPQATANGDAVDFKIFFITTHLGA